MWYQKRFEKNKYGAISREYNGVLYHSKLEAKYASELDLELKEKKIKSWRRQVKISLDVYGYHICNYYVDFEVTHNDKTIELVEVKGFPTEVWRLKWKLLEAIYQKEHPEIILTVVK